MSQTDSLSFHTCSIALNSMDFIKKWKKFHDLFLPRTIHANMIKVGAGEKS